MRIETKRLMLRNYKETDIDDYFEYVSQPDVGPRCGWQPYTSKDEAMKRLLLEASKPYQFAIVLKESNKVIGSVEIMNLKDNSKYPFLDSIEGVKEIGCLINQDYWNNGYMTEALEVIIATCFEVLDYKALVASYFEPNGGSGRVQEKCGFKTMGKLKDYITWYLTNEPCDLVINLLTQKDYNKNKTNKEIVITKED